MDEAMVRYEGTKRLGAVAMNRGEYNAYRGCLVPSNENPADEGYLVEYEDGGTPNHPLHTGYISWSPKDVFERSYKAIPAAGAHGITGYRVLSDAEKALINEGKALAEQCGAYIARLRALPAVPVQVEGSPTRVALDQRWISIGATDLQRGFMAVIRGIAQPTTF